MNPWEGNDKAFEPMFTESVSVHGARGDSEINCTVKAVVFTDCTGVAFGSDSVNTDREDITVSVAPGSWGYVKKIRRGDTVFRPFNAKRYRVSDVKNDIAVGWVITAREI